MISEKAVIFYCNSLHTGQNHVSVSILSVLMQTATELGIAFKLFIFSFQHS